MSYQVKPKEYESVVRLDGNMRYQYLLGKVADWQDIWTITGEQGFQLLSDGQTELVPVWPAEAYAAAACREGQEPRKIDIRDWIDKWLPGMRKDGRKVAVFPLASGASVVVEPERFQADLQQYLDAYEE